MFERLRGETCFQCACLGNNTHLHSLVSDTHMYTYTYETPPFSRMHRLVEKRGMEATFFDGSKHEELVAALRPGATRILWIESPTNPDWQVIDIEAAAKAAHEAGALLAVDCTASPPCTTMALRLGADVVFHSATKYLNGHSDLTAGVLSVREKGPLWEELVFVRTLQGTILGAFEAWLLVRGLRTLFLRFERASENAMAIAKRFQDHPAVERVMYPGLPSHPLHDVARKQMTGGFGGMLSMTIKGGEAAARAVACATRVFHPATSLGGVESLIEHRKSVEGPYSVVEPHLIRLSVGIENVADLIGDLEQALAAIPAE
eukprot:m.53398 g.53398  ORF g.53398 m.53398 type:complete len:318 (+) comp12380_c0_seq1:465-1418(+)